jgi:hypothetical protein
MLKLVVGSLAAVIGLASLPFAVGQPAGSRAAHAAEFADCAKACGQCALACDQCAGHCGVMLADGKKDHLVTLRTCQDCASVCGSAACITGKAGPFSDLICKACADACKRCGDECEKRSSDPVMKKCADECRRCEKACREMLKHVG